MPQRNCLPISCFRKSRRIPNHIGSLRLGTPFLNSVQRCGKLKDERGNSSVGSLETRRKHGKRSRLWKKRVCLL